MWSKKKQNANSEDESSLRVVSQHKQNTKALESENSDQPQLGKIIEFPLARARPSQDHEAQDPQISEANKYEKIKKKLRQIFGVILSVVLALLLGSLMSLQVPEDETTDDGAAEAQLPKKAR